MNERNVETRLLLFRAYTHGDDCFCSNIFLLSLRNLDFRTFRRGILTCFQISLHSAAINQEKTGKNPLQPINNSVIYFENLNWENPMKGKTYNIICMFNIYHTKIILYLLIHLQLKVKWMNILKILLNPGT